MNSANFLEYSVRKLRQYLDRIEVCLGKLGSEQLWLRGTDNENSVGNLCLHLSGNLRQWILTGLGGKNDIRNRDSEFQARGGMDSEQLAGRLRETVVEVSAFLEAFPHDRLDDNVSVQGYHTTAAGAIYHVVEHFAYHAGQILYATKAYTGEDLGFHRHLSQPIHTQKAP